VLAAIIANLQNVPQPTKLPPVHIDRGGGGPSWPRHDIIDIIAAINTFPEIHGEHPVARATRRHKWIGEALPGIKEAREKREAAAFLAGITLGDAAAEERHAAADAATAAQRTAMDQLKIEQLIEIIDSVRGVALTPVAVRAPLVDRGARAASVDGLGFFIGGLLAGGLLVGITLARRRVRR
jgi:hypothetical protein